MKRPAYFLSDELFPKYTKHDALEYREARERMQYLKATENTAYYRLAKFFLATVFSDPIAARQCRDNLGIPIVKAESEGLPSSGGGYLVPDEIASTIITLRDAFGVARAHSRIWPLRIGSATGVPRRAAGAKATWGAEGAALAETSVSFDSVGLNMKKLSALIRTSVELEEDAIAAFGEFLASELAFALAQSEDDACFNGDGTSTFGGITGISAGLSNGTHAGKITAAGGHNTFATVDATDIGALIGALPARALPNAKIFASVACYGNTIVRLASSGGGLVATVDAEGGVRANCLGFPIVFVPSLPSTTSNLSGKMMLCAGDMRAGVALGERRTLTVRRLAERWAEFDQVGFSVSERVDIVVADLGDSTSAGALVGLFAP